MAAGLGVLSDKVVKSSNPATEQRQRYDSQIAMLKRELTTLKDEIITAQAALRNTRPSVANSAPQGATAACTVDHKVCMDGLGRLYMN